MPTEIPQHADPVGKEDEPLGLELVAKPGRHVGQLRPVAREAKHSRTLAAPRPVRSRSRDNLCCLYCTVTIAVYWHTGAEFLPTKLE
ncbi:hypothetical protein ATCCBAA256_28920 [Mycobacterium montefiorense]|nr:hypothetical protein ATCCBAA256_28920 [Mycobacterium montefiorense]